MPISSYNTSAFSPRAFGSGKKDRDGVYSPVSMKAFPKKCKKGHKHKQSASRKRDSHDNQSKNFDDFTMYSTRNKSSFKYNQSKNIIKNNTKSAYITSHKRTSSKQDIHASGGSRKRKSKRTTTLVAKDFNASSGTSFMKKNQKTIFKMLNNK